MRLCNQPFKGQIRPMINSIIWQENLQAEKPDIQLKLDYVHGSRVKDCRNQIRFVDSEKLVYTQAALGINLDTSKNEQKFFTQHKDDILCMDISADLKLVATGEQGEKPGIFIWDSLTMERKASFNINYNFGLKMGIVMVRFSKDGSKLIAVDRQSEHNFVIFNLKYKNIKEAGDCIGTQIVNNQLGKDLILDLKWISETQFATVGPNLFKFFRIEPLSKEDKTLIVRSEKGRWKNSGGGYVNTTQIEEKQIDKGDETKDPLKYSFQSTYLIINGEIIAKKMTNRIMLTFEVIETFYNQDAKNKITFFLAPASNGEINLFNQEGFQQVLKVSGNSHSKCINTIKFYQDLKLIITGGDDGKIIGWDHNVKTIANQKNKEVQFEYEMVAQFNISYTQLVNSICPKIMSIDLNNERNKLVVQTYGSEIFLMENKGTNEKLNFEKVKGKLINSGHYTPNRRWLNEIWGLNVNPQDPDIFVTCSDDSTIRFWSQSQKKQIKLIKVNQEEDGQQTQFDQNIDTKGDLQNQCKARKIAFSQDAKYLFVGTLDGTIRIFSVKSSKLLYKFRPSVEEISEIKISPDGTIIAIGSHDNQIYTYKISYITKEEYKQKKKEEEKQKKANQKKGKANQNITQNQSKSQLSAQRSQTSQSQRSQNSGNISQSQASGSSKQSEKVTKNGNTSNLELSQQKINISGISNLSGRSVLKEGNVSKAQIQQKSVNKISSKQSLEEENSFQLNKQDHEEDQEVLIKEDLEEELIPILKEFGLKKDKHSSYITHLDFSIDGQFLQSTCGAYELLFWDVRTGKQLRQGISEELWKNDPEMQEIQKEKPKEPEEINQFNERLEYQRQILEYQIAKLKINKTDELKPSPISTTWHDYTCVLGWGIQGIWRDSYDGTDINQCHRSNNPFGLKYPNNYYLMAFGDDDGRVNVSRFPCLRYGSDVVEGFGHSSHVTNLKFNKYDDYIFSTGGEDQAVIQWKIIKNGKYGINYREQKEKSLPNISKISKISKQQSKQNISISNSKNLSQFDQSQLQNENQNDDQNDNESENDNDLDLDEEDDDQ